MSSSVFNNSTNVSRITDRGIVVFPSKFRPPEINPQHIVRNRLLTKLNSFSTKDLTLVCACAGFGKSILLRQWYAELKRAGVKTIWIKLDSTDKESTRFLTHFVSALTSDYEATQEAKTGPAKYSEAQSPDALLQRLYNAINTEHEPCVLILDAYEQASSTELNRTIELLVELMPKNFHLAISSRITPEELTGKLWGQDRINRITANDLCFTEDEVINLLEGEADVSLSIAQTQGWPIAVQFLGKELRDSNIDTTTQVQDRHTIVTPLSQFVWTQILISFSETIQQTLIKTSFLEEIIPELADRICQHDKSSALFEELTQLNPLVKNKVGTENNYIINPLLRESLHLSLYSLREEDLRHVHTTVVDWYLEQRDVARALHYAKLAKRSALFVKIVEYFGAHAITILDGASSLKQAMENINANDINKIPRLMIANAVVLIKDGHFSVAQRKLEQVEKILDHGNENENEYYGSVKTDYIATQFLMALYKNENFNREYLDQCEIEVYKNSEFEGLIGFLHALKSLFYQRNASFSRSEAEAERALRYYKVSKSNYGIASVHIIRGLCYFTKGQLDLATRAYENASTIIEADFSDDPGLNAIVNSLVAEIKYERNEIDSLASQLEGTIDALESYDGWLDTFVAAYRVAVAIAMIQRDPESAHIILDRAVLLARERSLDEISRLAHLQRINIYIRTGALDVANKLYQDYLDEHGSLDSIHDKQLIWRELDSYYFTTARLFIAQGNGETALTILEPIVQEAHKTGRLLSLTNGHVLQTLAYQVLDKQDEAIAVLRHAVTIGCSEKYLRVFLDEGDGIIPILQHVIDSERRGSSRTKLGKYCSKILSGFRREMDGNQITTSMTPRERQILIGLSHGNSNKIIARDLGITESTIKFHLKKVYAKLGVSKRSSAVVEARRQQLLPR